MSSSQDAPVYFTTTSGKKLAVHAKWIIYTANLLSDWLRLMHQGFELDLKTIPTTSEGASALTQADQLAHIDTLCHKVESTLTRLLPHIIQASHVDPTQLDDPKAREDVLSYLLLPEPERRQVSNSPTAQDQLTHSIQQTIELVRSACHQPPEPLDEMPPSLLDMSALSAHLETIAQQAFERAMGAENIVGSDDLDINADANEALKTAFANLQDHIAPQDAALADLAPLSQRFLQLYEGATLQTVLHMQGMMLPEDGGEAFQTAGNVLANFGMLQTSWEDVHRLALSSNPRMALTQELYVITNTLGQDIRNDGQIKETVCTSFQIAADKPPTTPLSADEQAALAAARTIMTTRLHTAERDLHRVISAAPAPKTPVRKAISGVYN